MKCPVLALLSEQSALAPALLELAKGVLLSSPEYIERIKRHYALFRGIVDGGPASGGFPEEPVPSN